MKTLRVLCLLSITVCSADTFIGPSAEGHQIIVPTNKVISIESIRFNNYPTNISELTYFSAGSDQVVIPPNTPTYVAGPGELIVPRGAWAQFTILDNFGIQTIYMGAQSNIVVNLDAGQSIRWFNPVTPGDYYFTVTDADQRSVSFQATRQATAVHGQLTGPITVTFFTRQSPMFFNYQFVSGGTNRVVILQKSIDLSDWQTVDVFPASDEPIVFYRLDAKWKQQSGN